MYFCKRKSKIIKTVFVEELLNKAWESKGDENDLSIITEAIP